ncbi:hypothetical protein CSUB01_12284 [Colletotrichum sublineola]|uniref:Uncharacterized protein n=1 Tax=Colletotrichum sublineola TaxID=1173701 RepID=A0A066XDF8_COLSU|nr:hypothetical protein CSUB01_12284 [Colletotrichum sublineola]
MQQDTTSQFHKCPRERQLSRCHEAGELHCTIRLLERSRTRLLIHEGTISRTLEEDFCQGTMPKSDWALTPEKDRRKACEAPFSPRSGRLSETRPMGGNTEVMIKQPEACPITQEQFVAEVRGVFAGLVMVESKCIEVDNAQNSSSEGESDLRANNKQWGALHRIQRTTHLAHCPESLHLNEYFCKRHSKRRII